MVKKKWITRILMQWGSKLEKTILQASPSVMHQATEFLIIILKLRIILQMYNKSCFNIIFLIFNPFDVMVSLGTTADMSSCVNRKIYYIKSAITSQFVPMYLSALWRIYTVIYLLYD